MLGINNNIPLEIAQDTLNPTLRQTITRYITIDSQYRSNLYPYSFDPNNPKGSDTNFTCSLTEDIKNVLSLKLVALNIPATSYVFDSYIGNTCFWVLYSDVSNTTFSNEDSSCCQFCISQGNYANNEDILNELNFAISDCCPDLSGLRVFYQDPYIQNKLLQFLNVTSYYIKIVFWPVPNYISDCSGCGNLNPSPCIKNLSYTQNLGYYLGYRILNNNTYSLDITIPPIISLSPSVPTLSTLILDFYTALSMGDDISVNIIGIEMINDIQNAGVYYTLTDAGYHFKGQAITSINLNDTQYILFILDDYNRNYANNGSIGIAAQNTKLDLPTYAIKLGQDSSANVCNPNTNTTQYVPTFPRKLTQAQLYSVNQIVSNRHAANNSIQAPNNSNLFATIYTNQNNNTTYHNPNMIYERKYFGPITLERLGIKLIDDKGNLVNLHGHNWSFTLAVEQLYQY